MAMATSVTTGIVELLEQGFGWTDDRLARVGPGDLDAPTPCDGWRLRDRLNHMRAGGGEGGVARTARDRLGDDCGRSAFAEVRERALRVWQAPGVMERTCGLP